MSEFVCVFPFPDGDTRVTQLFILFRAIEGPTSTGGEIFYIHAAKCLYRGVWKVVLRVVSPCPYLFLGVPFYSSKGRPGLQVVGNRIGIDRGMAR